MNRGRVKELLPDIEKLISLVKEYWRSVESGVPNYVAKEMVTVRYLNMFNYDDIVLFEALMYIGRDDYISYSNYECESDYYRDIEDFYREYDVDQSVINMWNDLYRHGDTQGARIEHMLAKKPVAQYLEQGLEVIKIKSRVR